jgi:membrane protein
MASASGTFLGRAWAVIVDAFGHFNADDGWAMASHVALSCLLALFPFLIFVAALAGAIGEDALAARVAEIMFAMWPREVAGPIASEVQRVLTADHQGLLTISAVVAAYLASNGIEATRTALNRAYRVVDRRSIFFRRSQSLVFVLAGAGLGLSLAFLAALGFDAMANVAAMIPALAPLESLSGFARIVVTTAVLVVSLSVCHLWLPAGRPRWFRLWPGILLTLVGWVISAWIFRIYLGRFSNMAATYAGLASVFTAVFFLYIVSVLAIFGGEFNAALGRLREGRIG